MGAGQPWNLNIHYAELLEGHVGSDARDVLDVGCGDGFLAARLAARVPSVTAIDTDAPVLGRARQRFPTVAVQWLHGDVLTTALPTFDVVVSNAALHHLGDTRTALRRLSALVRPAGHPRSVAGAHACRVERCAGATADLWPGADHLARAGAGLTPSRGTVPRAADAGRTPGSPSFQL
jgi:trans-aconitate methyltransferase